MTKKAATMVLAAAALAGALFAVGADKAALAKVTVPVTQPKTPAPPAATTTAGQPTPVPPMAHAVTGHENCVQCHEAGDIKPMPAAGN